MSAWTTQVRVGTASWSEPEFVRAGWYPPGLAAGQRLAYYARHFDLVELNSSFYALPQARQCERWVKETPPGFLFDAKVHRLLSRHATRPDALPADLRDQVEVTDRGNVVLTPMLEEEMAGRLLDALEPLERAGKLGALLLQLTPSFAPRACDLGQLEDLLRLLRGKGKAARQIVVELRNRGWLEGARRQETVAFFREQGVTLASIDGPPSEAQKHPAIMPAVDEITDERLTYLRLHGRDPKAYLTGRDRGRAVLLRLYRRRTGRGSGASRASGLLFGHRARGLQQQCQGFRSEGSRAVASSVGTSHCCSRRRQHCPQALRPAEAGNAVLSGRRLREEARLVYLRVRLPPVQAASSFWAIALRAVSTRSDAPRFSKSSANASSPSCWIDSPEFWRKLLPCLGQIGFHLLQPRGFELGTVGADVFPAPGSCGRGGRSVGDQPLNGLRRARFGRPPDSGTAPPELFCWLHSFSIAL